MKVTLAARLAIPMPGGRARGLALTGAAVLMAGGLLTAVTQTAGAQPQPSISQVQARVNSLTAQFNKANQQYDQVEVELATAKRGLRTLDRHLARDEERYKAARRQVIEIANSSYEDSAQSSLAGLLTASNPGQVLTEASIILQVTNTRNMETQNFLKDAAELASVRQEQQRTEEGIAQLAARKGRAKNHVATLLDSQKTLLDSLTAQQQQAVQAATINSGGGTTTGTYTGPTKTQAQQAVAFAFNQLGCPYVFGSTGPCSAGFDCSGLVMAAWASAGVSIPRDTYQQWAALPHISVSALQPGDLLYYNGIGHVAMYVGNGMIIDAPSPGSPVRELSMNTAWYAASFDGAARP